MNVISLTLKSDDTRIAFPVSSIATISPSYSQPGATDIETTTGQRYVVAEAYGEIVAKCNDTRHWESNPT